MELTLSADWTQPTPDAIRLAIGGYTAVVQTVDTHDLMGRPVQVYEYTVLRDHLEIIGVGNRPTLAASQQIAEELIAAHAQAAQWERQAEVAR